MSSPPSPNWYSDPPKTPATGPGGSATPWRKRRGLLIAGGAAGTLVLLGVVGNVGADKDQPSSPTGTTTTTVTTSVTTSPSTIASTTAPTLSTEPPPATGTVIVVPPGGDDSTDVDVPPPAELPTVPTVPENTIPQTTHELVPSAPAVAPFRSCAAARAAGAAPVYRGDPGYSSAIDRDGDGVACEGG